MRRHRLDPYSLTFGLAFAGAGALMLDTDIDAMDLAGAGWLPVPLVLLGLFLLSVGIDRARSKPLPPSEEQPTAGEDAEA